MFKCIYCGKETDIDIKATKKIQCPYCGYRVLKKTRSGGTNRVLAR